jgi:hypothetical protein
VQEPDSFPERRAVVCPVCTSAARKIKVALARARDGVHQEGLVSASRGYALNLLSGRYVYPRWMELGKGTSLPRPGVSDV